MYLKATMLQPILTPNPNPQPSINQLNCLQGEIYLFTSDWPLKLKKTTDMSVIATSLHQE